MNALFGIPTSNIMVVLVALFALAVGTVVAIGLGNRTMFRLGLRNLPRRGTQTVLVVAGLTLSTLIVTAAFVTGDTIDYSFTKSSYDLLQRSDIDIAINGEHQLSTNGGLAVDGLQKYVDSTAVDALETRFAGDPDIDGFLPYLYQQAAVTDQRSNMAKPVIEVAGFDPARQAKFGGLAYAGGGAVDLSALGPDDVLVSEKAAGQLHTQLGDTLTVYLDNQPHDVHVAGIVRDEVASGVLGLSFTRVPGGIAMRLDRLQELSGHQGEVSAIRAALKGDVRTSLEHSAAARTSLDSFVNGEGASLFAQDGNVGTVKVVELKQDSIDTAELESSVFTTLFLVFGLFSMVAGIMLIFMIFVMLAAERREEMGMARAVGAQRSHLVQSFIAEGLAYSLLAGIGGAALGVLCSLGMTVGLLKVTGGDSFALVSPHVTLKSIVIGYTLGVVVTFLTVTFASLKASHVNIVAAIRSLPETAERGRRRKTRWLWVALGVPALLLPPVGLWFVLRKGFGISWAMILAPVGIVAGLLFMQMGKSSEVLFPFALGISLLPLCVAAIARHFGAPNRPTWTLVGVVMAAYWLMPSGLHDRLFGNFDSNIEMFVLSAVMIVISFTLIIVFNARLLTGLFTRASGGGSYAVPVTLAFATAVAATVAWRVGDGADGLGQLVYLLAALLAIGAAAAYAAARFPQIAPALKMAVAYPLANRFRTGMTIAMFSIIVFSLTVFSILVSNFSAIAGGDSARGGVDIVGSLGNPQPIDDLQQALTQAGSPQVPAIAAVGRVTIGSASQELRRSGDKDWSTYPIIAADDQFFAGLEPTLDATAYGYDSEAAVLDQVRTHDGFGLVDAHAFVDNNQDVYINAGVTDHHFQPFTVDVRDTATGKSTTVTIIGELKTNIDSRLVDGVYVNQSTYASVVGTPVYQRYFARLAAGSDSKAVAAGIESALGTSGVSADSVKQLIDDQSAEDATFQRMFQAFMALGLVVGIAGLGVIAFRSVVERRQQIGMLRAIGFQRGTVTLTFLLESSFVAVMGILSGVVGGAIIARNLLTSDNFTDGQSITFAIPWAELALMVGIAYVFALLMTWWPSRGASRVPVAEALRYE